MKTSWPVVRFVKLMLVSFGAMVCTEAFAAEEIAAVTVTATRMTKEVVTADLVGRSQTTGAPIERIKLERSVPFADLDLRTNSGSTELVRRVNAVAVAACKELDGLFPSLPPGGPSCVKDATAGAMTQAHRLISAAGKMRATHDKK